MNLIRYNNPWGLMDRLHRDVDRLVSARLLAGDDEQAAERGSWAPAIDVKEEDSRFLIHADVPGVNAEDLEITMEDGVVSIQGRRHANTETDNNGWHRVERVSGRFYRRLALPDTADAEGINAEYNNGVLEIEIPKQAKSLPRRIQVKAN